MEKRKKKGMPVLSSFKCGREMWRVALYFFSLTEEIDMHFVQSQKKAFVDPNDPTVIYIAQPIKPAASTSVQSS